MGASELLGKLNLTKCHKVTCIGLASHPGNNNTHATETGTSSGGFESQGL